MINKQNYIVNTIQDPSEKSLSFDLNILGFLSIWGHHLEYFLNSPELVPTYAEHLLAAFP